MEPWSLSAKRKARFKSVLAPLGKASKMICGEWYKTPGSIGSVSGSKSSVELELRE